MNPILWILFFWIAPVFAFITLYIRILWLCLIQLAKLCIILLEELSKLAKYLIQKAKEYRK